MSDKEIGFLKKATDFVRCGFAELANCTVVPGYIQLLRLSIKEPDRYVHTFSIVGGPKGQIEGMVTARVAVGVGLGICLFLNNSDVLDSFMKFRFLGSLLLGYAAASLVDLGLTKLYERRIDNQLT